MNEPCNKAEILHKDYSQESNQRREELYLQAFLTFFPLQVWTTRLSIHLRMFSRHQSLLAEIPSATSNGEISLLSRTSSAVQRVCSQSLTFSRVCSDAICLQKEMKTFCIRHQLHFSSDLLGILVPALHVFSANLPDATGWCHIFHPIHVSLASHPRSAILTIAQDSAQLPNPACKTCKHGELLCQGQMDKLFPLSLFPPQEWSRDAIYRHLQSVVLQSVQYHSPIWLHFFCELLL